MERKKHCIIPPALQRYIFSDELPYEARQLNAVYMVGILTAVAAGLVRFFMGNNIVVVLITFGIVVFIVAGMCLANLLKRYNLFRWILLTVLCNGFFPCAFFAMGGLESSMACFFVLSTLLVFHLTWGKTRAVLLPLHIGLIILCYYLNSQPRFASLFLENGINTYVDHVYTIIISGLCIGFIFAFQKRIYFEEKEKAETTGKDLEHRNKLLGLVNEAAEVLLTETDDLKKTLTSAMELMARGVGADRMYIWKNRFMDGEFRYEQQYEWLGDDSGGKTLYNMTGRYYLDAVPEWDLLFSEGNYINGPVSSLPEKARDALALFGICSILAIPVFLREKLWGFVSFDDMRREKTFSETEVSILKSGSLLLANAIVRRHSNIMLNSRIRQQELMAGISRSFLSREPIPRLIDETLKETGEFMNLSRIAIVVPNKGGDECHLAYSWFSSPEWRPRPIYMGFNPLIYEAFPALIPETGFVTAICCNDIKNEFSGKYRALGEVGIKSFIWAPVYLDGAFWGLISVEAGAEIRTWNESDIQLVGTVSSAIAGAMGRDIIDKGRISALDQAVLANKAKSNFLANMSHEMRTPMNAIIGMTAIGKNAESTEKKNYAFEKIENASSHLLGVINDILDMSKIEANKLELSFISFNFENMLQKAVNVVSFRMEERNQDFTVHIDERIPRFIVGDDQRMTQVITNLLSNAVKFTPENGNIRLNVKLANLEDGIYTIQIEIIDTGIGISTEQQAKLFSSFEQAESGTARKFGGTGLGLAISRRIVEMMGGRIWIESELGKGSTFAFTIKAEKGHGASQAMLSPGITIKNIRILAVDDNPDILEYFRDIMARFEINCDTALSAAEALRLIEDRGNYNLCFVDYAMPGIDGAELTREIKRRSAGKSLVVMISVGDWSSIEKAAKEAGVDHFLAKPLFPSPLADIINSCLGSGSAEKTEASGAEEAREETEDFSPYTMLLVEDVDINREIVTTILEPTGLTIDSAENGEVAVEKFTASPEKYHMIFMDIQMPRMDGYEATRLIRNMENKWAKEIPIVAMTANVFREDVERCLASGMNDHVGKPLDLDDVLVKLKKYLSRRDN